MREKGLAEKVMFAIYIDSQKEVEDYFREYVAHTDFLGKKKDMKLLEKITSNYANYQVKKASLEYTNYQVKENKKDGKIVRKTLDLLIKRAEKLEDFITIKLALEDYVIEGYYIKSQIQKYKDKINKFYTN